MYAEDAEAMLEKAIEMLRYENKVILVHGNADMDAIGSAYALSQCFPSADIFAPGGTDRVAKMVLDKLGFKVLEECDLSRYDLVVVVDTSSPEQFKPGDVTVPEGSLVIDHHRLTGRWDSMVVYCDEDKVSCTEIVLDIIKREKIQIGKNVGLALLGGMLTDSGHFQYADPTLLKDFAYIMDELHIGMDEAMNLTRMEMTMSERVAVMKCLERSKFDRVGDMIVATSYGGSFEASGCKGLLSGGADVVFVGSQRDDSFRLSARATQDMVRKGFHLGDILKDIGTETTTDGGGHGGAAGLSGIGDVEAMLHICMQRTMDEFRRIKKSSELA